MVMRNTPVSDVLRRRMFMTGPQFDRNDPVGIMGSSPELMQAVMRNQSSVRDFMDQPVVYPASSNFGFPTEDDPNITIGGDPINPPPTVDGGTGGGPQQQDPDVTNIPRVTIPVSIPKSETENEEQNTETNVSSLAAVSVSDMLKALKSQKSIDKFVEDKADLLEKYAPLPKAKNLRREYLTKFFLDMAARGAQCDKPLAAAATAAPGTFDEYLAAEEKQKDRLAERDLLSVSMGIADKKVQDASAQAINLKLLELAADQPEKMKQVRALMEMGLSETDALERVFPESVSGSTEFIYKQYIKSGHSHRLATIMAGNEEAFTKSLTNKNFFKALLGDPSLTKKDIELLVGYALLAATPEEINKALEVGGHTFRVPPSQPAPQS